MLRNRTKKLVALLLLVGLVRAITASSQESAPSPTTAPMVNMESALTATTMPPRPAVTGQKRSDLPTTATPAGMNTRETPTTLPFSNQVNVPVITTQDNFVTMNFTNVDIGALVKVMSELTRRNFILDERITGKVTLMTPTKISPDEAYQVFLGTRN